MTEKQFAENARQSMASFVQAMKMTAYRLETPIEFTDQDDEQVSFTLSGYNFTLTWDVGERECIGGKRPVIQFTLCVWYMTSGNRMNPPESIDTTLVTDQSINACVRCAFETVAKDEIRQALEEVDCAQILPPIKVEAGDVYQFPQGDGPSGNYIVLIQSKWTDKSIARKFIFGGNGSIFGLYSTNPMTEAEFVAYVQIHRLIYIKNINQDMSKIIS